MDNDKETTNIICSRGRICKDSNRGDKQSSLIDTTSQQGERLLWAEVSNWRKR